MSELIGPFVGIGLTYANNDLLMVVNPANCQQILQFSSTGSPQWVDRLSVVSGGGALPDVDCLLALTVDALGFAYATAPSLIVASQQYLYFVFPAGTTSINAAIAGGLVKAGGTMTVGGSLVDAIAPGGLVTTSNPAIVRNVTVNNA